MERRLLPAPCSLLPVPSQRFDQLIRDSQSPAAGDQAPPDGFLEEAATASLDGGVLDAKWSQHPADDGSAVMACVTSTGRLVLYSLRNADGVVGERAELQRVASSNFDDSLLLSLDWSRGTVANAKVLCECVAVLAVWPGAWTDGLDLMSRDAPRQRRWDGYVSARHQLMGIYRSIHWCVVVPGITLCHTW